MAGDQKQLVVDLVEQLGPRWLAGDPVKVELVGRRAGSPVLGYIAWERKAKRWCILAVADLDARKTLEVLCHELGHAALRSVGKNGDASFDLIRAAMRGEAWAVKGRVTLAQEAHDADPERERAADAWADDHARQVWDVIHVVDKTVDRLIQGKGR